MVFFIFHMACSSGSFGSIPHREQDDSLDNIRQRLALVRELLTQKGFNGQNAFQEVCIEIERRS